jgi:hypothetical protein
MAAITLNHASLETWIGEGRRPLSPVYADSSPAITTARKRAPNMKVLLDESKTSRHFPTGGTGPTTGRVRIYLVAIRRICLWILVGLVVGALAAIIALEATIYFWRI